MKIQTETTEDLLIQWGLWVHQRNPGAYTSPMLAIMNLAKPNGLSHNISDDSALRVDSAVARLKHRDADMFQVVWLKFVDNHSVRAISAIVKQDYRIVNCRLSGSVAWIDCYLNNFL